MTVLMNAGAGARDIITSGLVSGKIVGPAVRKHPGPRHHGGKSAMRVHSTNLSTNLVS